MTEMTAAYFDQYLENVLLLQHMYVGHKGIAKNLRKNI